MGSIYVLIDPQTNEIRYVGWTTCDLRNRLQHHIYKLDHPKHRNTYRGKWMRKLARLGLRPVIKLVQTVPLTNWEEAERYWIAYFKSQGCPLTNATLGGEGGAGHTVSSELRKAISLRHTGKTISDAQKQAISLAAKKKWADWRAAGRHTSEETRKKISEARIGCKASDEVKARMSLQRKGHSVSSETREKIAATQKRRIANDPALKERLMNNLGHTKWPS